MLSSGIIPSSYKARARLHRPSQGFSCWLACSRITPHVSKHLRGLVPAGIVTGCCLSIGWAEDDQRECENDLLFSPDRGETDRFDSVFHEVTEVVIISGDEDQLTLRLSK